MKKIKTFALLFLVLLCVCSCNQPGESIQTTTHAPEPTPFPTYEEFSSAVGFLKKTLNSHVNPSFSELTEIPAFHYQLITVPRGKLAIGNDVFSIKRYLNIFGIQYIAMIDDNNAYIVYKLVDDQTSVYVYRFFKRSISDDGTREYWAAHYGEVYYLSNSLAYKDFLGTFRVGNTLEQAIAIAPGLAFDHEDRYDYRIPYNAKTEIPTQTCYQLLKDGVLILRFEANCTTDEWEAQGKPNSALICTDMEFYPNGTAATVDGLELTVLTAPASKRPPLPEEPLTPSTPLPTGTTPLSDLTQYDYETYDIYTMQRNLVANTSLHLWSLDGFNSMFPVQRIEPLGNDHLCVIYSFETNEGLSTYVYAIFDRTAYTSAEKPYTGWSYDSEFYFVSRRLSRVNFSSIAVGDSATKVSAIDSSLMFEMRNHMMSETTHIIQAYKLLFDGLLIITLEAPRVDGTTISPAWEDYSVSEMKFYPHNSTDIPYNVSVLGYPDLLQDN